MGRGLGIGFLSARRQRLVARASAMPNLARTKQHTTEYGRFHFSDRREARRCEAAFASVPKRPSTENTRGVKCFRRS
jgi:hypothetical protein